MTTRVQCISAILFAIVAVSPLNVRGEPLITEVEELGGLDPVPPFFTGQTFDHEVEGADYTVGVLDEDEPFYNDRDHEYNGITAEEDLEFLRLVGAEIIIGSNDNKDAAGYELNVTVSQTVDAYVFMDVRVTQPDWLFDEGWNFLGHQVGIDEGGDDIGPGNGINNSYWVWRRSDVAPGTFSTFERGGSGNSQYGVAVTLPGVGPEPKDYSSDFTPGNFGVIDIGADDGRPEFGSLEDEFGDGQIGAASDGAEQIDLESRTMTSNFGDEFSIAIDNLDESESPVGAIDWRDRGDNLIAGLVDNYPLVKLGEDFAKNDQGVIRVTLSDLPAGDYEVTSFHIDTCCTQSEAIEVFVDVGDGYEETGELGDANFDVDVETLTPELILETSATFSFTADGANDVLILFDGRFAADSEVPLNGLSINSLGAGVVGDYNRNGMLDADDLDAQATEIRSGNDNPDFDLNSDGEVDFLDRLVWVKDLFGTWVGDSNLDGEFNSGDLVVVFTAGKYEDDILLNAVWAEGDWDGDGEFDSADFVVAFTDGGFELGPVPAVSAVPEPTSALMLIAGLLGISIRRRYFGSRSRLI